MAGRSVGRVYLCKPGIAKAQAVPRTGIISTKRVPTVSLYLRQPMIRSGDMPEKIRKWYEGEFVAYRNEPGSLVFMTGGVYRRHWTSRIAHIAVEFYLREWKWTLGSAAALIVFVLQAMGAS